MLIEAIKIPFEAKMPMGFLRKAKKVKIKVRIPAGTPAELFKYAVLFKGFKIETPYVKHKEVEFGEKAFEVAMMKAYKSLDESKINTTINQKDAFHGFGERVFRVSMGNYGFDQQGLFFRKYRRKYLKQLFTRIKEYREIDPNCSCQFWKTKLVKGKQIEFISGSKLLRNIKAKDFSRSDLWKITVIHRQEGLAVSEDFRALIGIYQDAQPGETEVYSDAGDKIEGKKVKFYY